MTTINAYIPAASAVALATKPPVYPLVMEAQRGITLYLSQQAKTATLQQRQQRTLSTQLNGYVVPNYYADLYQRVIVLPSAVDLGAIASEQVITVQLWNANKKAVLLTSSSLSQAEGITLNGPKLPHKLQALALSKWTINVEMNGPETIDSQVQWSFLDKSSVRFSLTGARSTDWCFFPNWAQEVTENLEFLTAVHQSYRGAEQRIARRLSPRRTFEFQVLVSHLARQQFDQALYAYGARVWAMPVFTDGMDLSHAVMPGTMALTLDTAGRDFTEGGRVLLMGQDGQRETAEITEITPTQLTLKRAIQGHYHIGARLYPIRSAILTDPPALRRMSDEVFSAQVRLTIIEHNGFADEVSYLPFYRGLPVLELAPDWSEDLTGDYQRLISELDNQTGVRYRLDTAERAFQVIEQQFTLQGRDEQRRFRQLCYYLRGRQKPIWVSSASTDFYVVDDVVGHYLDVSYTGYSARLLQQSGRQHIRIACLDGRIHYRRIVSATQINRQTERLVLDGEALSLKHHEIITVSFLSLSRLESDTISWQHKTDADGIATVSLVFRGVREDLEAQ